MYTAPSPLSLLTVQMELNSIRGTRT